MKKRLLALLLTVVMLVTMLPVQAFAAEDGEESTVPEVTEAAVIPETTAAPTVPETTAAPTVPETTAAPTVPETTVAPTVPETTAAPTVPETTEEIEPPLTITGDTPTSASCGTNLSWKLDVNSLYIYSDDTSQASVMDDYTEENPAPWSADASSIDSVIMSNANISTIGDNAFAGFSRVTSILLPKTLSEIKPGIFQDCANLTDFQFGNGNPFGFRANGTFLLKCDGEQYSLCVVGPGNTGEFEVPADVNHICSEAFAGCSKITSLTFQGAAPDVESNALAGLPDSITVNYYSAFAGWDTLTAREDLGATINWNAISLPTSGSCGADLYWEIEDSTLKIYPGSGAVGGQMDPYSAASPAPWKEYADQITTISMTGGTTISNHAFAGLTKVTTVNLPGTLLDVEDVFGDLTSLTTFTIPEGNDGNYSVVSDGNAIVRENLGEIYLYAVAPTVSGEYTVPDNVTEIHLRAFAGCSQITRITFPESLTFIPAPFYNCTALEELVFMGPAPDTCYEDIFAGFDKIKITYYPDRGDWSLWREAFSSDKYEWNPICTETVTISNAPESLESGNYRLYSNPITDTVTITNAPASLVSGKYVTLKASSTNGGAITWALDEQVYAYQDEEGYRPVEAGAEGQAAPKASDYATISSTSGKLTAKKSMGQSYYVRVIASSEGANPAEAYIRMIPLTSKITFSNSPTIEANVGSTYTVDLNDPNYEGTFSLFAQGLPLGANSKLSWSFSSAAKGLVTRTKNTDDYGVSGYNFTTKGKTGSFTITVSAGDGSKVTRKITVKLVKYAHDLTIKHSLKQRLLSDEEYGYAVRGGSKVTLSTNVAASKSFTDKTVKWTVDCPKGIATIDSKGVLTTYAVAEQRRITVTATYPATGLTDTLEITLLPAVDGIYIAAEQAVSSNTYALLPEVEADERGLSKESLSAWDIAYGNIRLKATCLPDGSMSEGTWSVSSTKIAGYVPNEDGSITLIPKKAGKVTVTFTTSDGTKTKATKTINFIAPVNAISVTYNTLDRPLTSGDTWTFDATAWTIEDSVKASTQQFYWWLSELFEYTDDNGETQTSYRDPDFASISSSGKLTIGTVTKNAQLSLQVACVDSDGYWLWADPIEIHVKPKQEKTLVLRLGHPGPDLDWVYYPGTSYSTCPTYELPFSCAWYNSITGKYEELAPGETVKITSDNPKVVSINGTVDYTSYTWTKAKTTTGTATITAKYGDQKATLKITNKYLPSRIQVTTRIPSYLRSGSTLTLKATVWTDYEYWGGDTESYKSSSQKVYWEGPFEWDSENDCFVLDEDDCFIYSDAATINSSGKITAKTVSKAETVAFICYSNAYDCYAETYVPITIRPKADYKATIYFTSPYGYESAYSGTVNYPINIDDYKSISANNYRLSVYDAVNDKILSDEQIAKITWKSSSNSIAKFDSAGTLNFLKKDTVTLTGTATLTNGKTVSASVKLKVVNAITGITLGVKGGKDRLCSAASLTMTAKLSGSPSSTKLIWQVADVVDGAPDWYTPSKYATINSSGVLKAEKVYNGQYPIAVRAISADFGFAVSDPVFLTVCPKTTAFRIYRDSNLINNTTQSLDYGAIYDLYVDICPSGAICQELTWSSSSKSVAEVISQEVVGGRVHVRLKVKKKGSTTIKATTTDGTKLSISFKVTSKNKSVPQPAPQ